MTIDEILTRVEAENARSKAKYGYWRDIPKDEQRAAVDGEFEEWQGAYDRHDIYGPHGEIAEAVQTINVLIRRVQYLTGEVDA